jgi:hypothetical protein
MVDDVKAGEPFTCCFVICDSFGNTLEHTEAASTTYIEEAMKLVHAEAEVTNEGDALWASTFPQEVRTADVKITTAFRHLQQAGSRISGLPENIPYTVAFTCTPTLAGVLTMKLRHKESEICLGFHANVLHGSPSSVNVAAIQEVTHAGQPLMIPCTIRDTHGNWIHDLKTDEITVQAMMRQGSKLTPASIEIRKGLASALITTGPVGDIVVSFTVCGKLFKDLVRTTVVPGPISAERCTLSVDRLSVAAGESCTTLIHLFDKFGNPVSATTTLPQVHGINGTAKPQVSLTTNDDRCVVVASMTPLEKGTAQFVVTDESGQQRKSETIEVTPAEMNWEKCVLTIADPHVELGSTSNVLLKIRDCFGNPVEANASQFTLTVFNNGKEIPCDQFLGKGKALLNEIKPVEKGKLQCKASYVNRPGDEKSSNIVDVL